jgi:preprotein translocase subunit SecG
MLTVIHVLVALFLIVLVLMQKSSEQGVGAAFGGGFTESVFGAGTTTALVRLTIWCACILLATTLSLAILHSHRGGLGGAVRQMAPRPTAPETPAPVTGIPTTTPATPVTPLVPATQAPAPVTPATTPQTEQAK